MRRIADELRQIAENCVEAREDRIAAIADIRADAQVFVEELPPQIQEIKDETHVLLGELPPHIQEIKNDTHVLIADLRPEIEEIRRDVREELADVRQAMGDFFKVTAPAKRATAPLVTVAGDDLTQIQGLGPASEEPLNNAGVTSFTQLATSTPEELQDELGEVGARLLNVEEWIEQARDLAA